MNWRKYTYRVAYLGLLSLLVMSFSYQRKGYAIKNTTFIKGEKIDYRLHYGLITGAYPTLSAYDKDYTIGGVPCHRLEVYGKSVGMINKLFKVKDIWRSYVDTTSMLPVYAFRQINEGNYKLQEDLYLNRNAKGQVKVIKDKGKEKEEKFYNAQEGIHDIVSGFYYFRNIDYTSKTVGSTVAVKVFFEDELYDLKVKYLGKEELKTTLGTIESYKLAPIVPDNDLFDGQESIVFWLSADQNKIPLKIKANMFVGAVELDINQYQNLRHPIKFK